jgi:hypothetical protein
MIAFIKLKMWVFLPRPMLLGVATMLLRGPLIARASSHMMIAHANNHMMTVVAVMTVAVATTVTSVMSAVTEKTGTAVTTAVGVMTGAAVMVVATRVAAMMMILPAGVMMDTGVMIAATIAVVIANPLLMLTPPVRSALFMGIPLVIVGGAMMMTVARRMQILLHMEWTQTSIMTLVLLIILLVN